MPQPDFIEAARPQAPAVSGGVKGSAFEQPAYSASAVIEEFDRRDRDLTRALYAWHNATHQYFQMQTARALLATLRREGKFPLDKQRILDVGCGEGGWLLEFAKWGAAPENLAGIELNPRRIDYARRRLPRASLHQGDARRLPWADREFDILTQITVLATVVSRAARRQIAAEMLRVLRPGGMILSYDMRIDNPTNDQVRALSAGEIRELFPRCAVRLRSVTLAPPLARRIVPVSWIAAMLLEKIPFLRTHWLAVIHKPAMPSR